MQISMMSYTLARGEWGKTPDPAALCRLCLELGLGKVDWVTTHGLDPRRIREVTDDHGLENICHTVLTEIQGPDEKTRRRGLEQVRQGLETAAVLGAGLIMLPVKGVPGMDRNEVRKTAIEGLAEAVALGRQEGITVSIEHYAGTLSPFAVPADVNEAVRAVPGLKITYDNGNIFVGGNDPAEGFVLSGRDIIHAHFKDFELFRDGLECLDGNRYRGVLVGEGLVDPLPCLRAMHACGYRGCIDFEYEGSAYTPEEAMRKAVPKLKRMIESLGDPDFERVDSI